MSADKREVTADDIDRWTRHLWHTSQHNRMVIGLAGRLQRLVAEMREAAGLPEFGWNTAFPDADFGECSVHVESCQGQEHHGDSVAAFLSPGGAVVTRQQAEALGLTVEARHLPEG